MWYYASNEQQHGPVDEGALDKLVADGVVTADTLVWKDGLTDWMPLGQLRTFKKADLPAPDAASTCGMCGKNVGADNLIDLLGVRVCAACKPMALQTLREGVNPTLKEGSAWRDGKHAVTYNQKTLPARCYKCNHPVAEPPIKRKLYWHPVAYYVFLFLNLFIYVIIAMFVRKRAEIEVYVCSHHRQRRKYFIIGGWCGAFLGFTMIMVGVTNDASWLTGLGFLGFLGAIVAAMIGASLISAARIKGDTVWLRGAGQEFLASLPPWS